MYLLVKYIGVALISRFSTCNNPGHKLQFAESKMIILVGLPYLTRLHCLCKQKDSPAAGVALSI